MNTDEKSYLLRDSALARLISDPPVSRRTLDRYRQEGLLPNPIKIRGVNYTPRALAVEAIERLMGACNG